jgi:type III restriction enzyme
MTRIYLQQMLNELAVGGLPPNWQGFDLEQFSREKFLWDYQRDSLQNAIKALHQYFSPLASTSLERKQAFLKWYEEFGLDEDLDIPLDTSSASKRSLARLLADYYPITESTQARRSDPTQKINYVQFINRMAFWMATGSGKTLVIVKLIEILHELMRRKEIPNRDILILAHRDDLLEQLITHVNEFNTVGDLTIHLHELRDYNEVKFASPRLFTNSECHIFYYRSDNLSDEQKDKIIDFRSYDNKGEWYVLLDEAHKGDKEDSKRQHIYSILSRNGFLFNFSATFTDRRDIITTAFNFNLSEFIRKGFGKHIFIFNQETSAFRKKEDFTETEKQKIVLKALIMLCLTRQKEGQIRAVDQRLYHRPLLMTLVNSVNTKEADLKMFFRELVRIGKGEIEAGQWQVALTELRMELGARPAYMYEADTLVRVSDASIESLTRTDLLSQVFNSTRPGEIEVLVRPSDKQELALKLRTSEEPFALIRIGDVSDWLTKELSGYEINTHFNDESFFERLNKDGSDINLLLGSRSFYEGWDSNRPNVIMYINIGVGTDAKKFILQSVGRGARIEPLPGLRKRLANLKTAGLLTQEQETLYAEVREHINLLESEFIFGTNREALETVIGELDQEDKQAGGYEIALELNHDALVGTTLLVPVYRQQDYPLYKKRTQAKFSLSEQNLATLRQYLDYFKDDRVLMALQDAKPAEVAAMRESVEAVSEHFRTDGPSYKDVDVLVNQVIRYSTLYGKEFQNFKVLEDEINHFRHVRVMLPEVDFENFKTKLDTFKNQPHRIAELKAKYDAGQLSFEQMVGQIQSVGSQDSFTYRGQTVSISKLLNHYYLPLLISEDEKIDYIRSVIKVRSEVEFLKKLENYLGHPDNQFQKFDWWLFSRIDETTDQVNVPYYNPYENKVLNFKPDFIFWLRKGQDYHVLFVDPKGTSRTEYEHKVDGFKQLFEKDQKPIVFRHESLKVQVHLFLFTSDKAFSADGYRRYWLDSVDRMLDGI